MGLRKFIRRATRKVENFAHRALGGQNIGTKMPGDNSGMSYAPAMQDVARSRAAGSGVVNYTDRTPGGV